MAEPSATPVSAAETERLRTSIHTMLTDAQEKATASHKPLTIVIGELHSSPHSKFIESLIGMEARKLGITDLSVELPERVAGSASPKLSDTQFVDFHLYQAKYAGNSLHYVDDLADLANNSSLQIDLRTEYMAGKLATIAAPNVMVTGISHLAGFGTNPVLNATHTVVLFNAAPDYGPAIPTLQTIENLPNYHTFRLEGDPREMDLRSIVTTTMGQDAAPFLQYLTRTGGINPQQSHELSLIVFSPADAMKQGNALFMNTISNAAYNLKLNDLAARTAALEQVICAKLPMQVTNSQSCFDDQLAHENRNTLFRNLVRKYEASMISQDNAPQTAVQRAATLEMVDIAQRELSQFSAPAPNRTPAKSDDVPPR